MSSNLPARRARRGTALTAALAIAAVGGPFAATAVIIAEQNHASSGTVTYGSPTGTSGRPGVTRGHGTPLTVSNGSTVVAQRGGGVSAGTGPAYTVSRGS